MKIPKELFWRSPGRFPNPDWDAIEELVVEDDLNAAWSEIAQQWMGVIAVALGPEYRIHSSRNFLVLSLAPAARLREIVLFLEDCHERILESLPFVDRSKLYGKVGVVVFANDSDFYEYLDLFQESEEGDYGAVGGVYLNSGYGHFAVPSEKIELYRSVMCHELCHAFLASFGLPAWLDEAITQEIEHKIVGGNPYFLDRETVRRHRDYWDDEKLAAFMSGESFWFADDGQELSYHLARYLFNALVSYSTPETMSRFIRSVSRDDAGFAAALEILDVDLEEVLEGLLEED
jgi:hypothetical protein